MDEADILGDRIAIMAEGQLRCCGSSLFLKKRYGVGYQLSIERTVGLQHTSTGGESYDDIETAARSQTLESGETYDKLLQSIVRGNVENAALLSAAAGEIKFQLPNKGCDSFVPMLQRLDDEVARGHIDSYGLSLTTLEEVFLLVSRGDKVDESAQFESSQRLSLTGKGLAALTEEDFETDQLFMDHVGALFAKRWLNFRRDHRAWLFTTILPSLIVCLGFLFSESLEVFGVWFLVVL